MNHKQILKRNNNLKLAATYTAMALAVVIIVTFTVFFILGYRFDADNGQIEQYSFLQFNSMPSGATVKVDGVALGSRTPSKTSLPAGKHEITIQRDGYQPWHKTVEVKSGTLTWLDYALLVPKKLTIETVSNYVGVYQSLASVEGRSLIIHEKVSDPIFDVIDLSSDVVKNTRITLPIASYSESTNPLMQHAFRLKEWDAAGRNILVEHIFGNSSEWLIVDTQNVSQSKNISTLFGIAISDIRFSGKSGNVFYALHNGAIRKVNLSDSTISRTLVSDVVSFSVYRESNTVSFVGTVVGDSSKRLVGLYRDSDSKAHILRTVTTLSELRIIASRYFNEDYVAVLEGDRIDILKGIYPSATVEDLTSLKILTSFNVGNISQMSFSPDGQYLLARAGSDVVSYDLEYQKKLDFKISGTPNDFDFGWLNDDYIWYGRDSKLSVSDFDGTNVHEINNVLVGQDVVITNNSKYLYSFTKTDLGYSLQRTLMVLP